MNILKCIALAVSALAVVCLAHAGPSVGEPVFDRFIGKTEGEIIKRFGRPSKEVKFPIRKGRDVLRAPIREKLLSVGIDADIKESIYSRKGYVVFIWYVEKEVWVVVGDAYVPEGVAF
jgi:hypothetical protein